MKVLGVVGRLAVIAALVVVTIMVATGTDLGVAGFVRHLGKPTLLTTEVVASPPPAAPTGPLQLVAGTPGPDLATELLYSFEAGSWSLVPSVEAQAGRGYFAAAATGDKLALTQPPVRVTVSPGWNLVGNSSDTAVVLPAGLTAWTWNGAAYEKAATLAPGQGAWVRAAESGIYILDASTVISS